MPVSELLVGAAMAVWLGILTSISPCPLATNIAAISYVGRRVGSARMVLFSGLLYTIGRTAAYILVALAVVKGILSIPGVSNFLQHYMNLILGPVCLVLGFLLLDIVKFGFSGNGIGQGFQKRVETMGIWGAGFLGFLFAMAFCPTSAGLFFGGLLPLALKNNGSIIMPGLYGIGTALPVIVFAFLIAFSTRFVGRVFNALTIIDLWSRRVTAVLFLFIGTYLVLKHWFNIYWGF